MRKKVNIIVLNYNGRTLLEECMPTIVDAAKASSHACRVMLLDNKSVDDSLQYMRAQFPSVIPVESPYNRFLISYNDLIKRVDDDIVILLNNDIKVDISFVDPLVQVFLDHEDAFMAGPKCWTFDLKQYEGSRTKMRMYFGHIQAFTRYPGYDKDMDAFGYSAAVGSVVAFDRERFLSLGGFDDLYLPGRVEDLDICYRGWKRGWKGYYQPKSLAFHKSSASFNSYFGARSSATLTYKNTFLFTWKNIFDPGMVFKHFVFLIPRLIFSIVSLDFCFFIGFFQAIPKSARALRERAIESKRAVVSDRDIFRIVGF